MLPKIKKNERAKMNSNYCEIYLIRHGQTNWNVEGKLQGHTDEPLNDDGEKQALVLQEKLNKINFSAVFSSDLSRASKTAKIVLGERCLEIVKTPALRERYMGSWEGRLTKDLKLWFKENCISIENFAKNEYLSYKWQSDIESYSNVYQRLYDFIKTQAISHLGSSILISTHGGVLRALLYHLDFPENNNFKWQVSNCAYIRLVVDDKGDVVIAKSEGVMLSKDVNIAF